MGKRLAIVMLILVSGCVSPKAKQDNKATTKPTQQTGTVNSDQKPEQNINAPTTEPKQATGIINYQGGSKNSAGIDPATLQLALVLVGVVIVGLIVVVLINSKVATSVAKYYAMKYGYDVNRAKRLEQEKKQ